MFLAIPCLILAGVCVVILPVYRIKRNLGVTWLITTVAAVGVLGWSVYSAYLPDRELVLLPSVSVGSYPLRFVFDRMTSALFITISAVFLLTLVTIISQFDVNSGIAQFLLMCAMTLVAFLTAAAADIWIALFCWMLFDVLSAAGRIRHGYNRSFAVQLDVIFLLRFFSTFLLGIAFAMQMREVWLFNAASFDPGVVTALILSAGAIRSGVLPLHQSDATVSDRYAKPETLARVLGNLIVLPVYLRLEPVTLPYNAVAWLRFFAVAAALVGSLGWLLSNRSVIGMNYFLIATAAYPLMAAMRFEKTAVVMYGAVFSVAAIAIFLHVINYRIVQLLLIGFLLLMSGVPMTPLAPGWTLIFDPYPSSLNGILVLSHSILLIGYGLSILRPRAYDPELLDRWVRTAYPFAYGLVFAATLFAAETGWAFWGETGSLETSVATVGGILLLGLIFYRYRTDRRYPEWHLWIQQLAVRTTSFLDELIGLRWAASMFRPVYGWFAGGYGLVSDALERDGGVVWEILLPIVILIAIAGRTGLWD